MGGFSAGGSKQSSRASLWVLGVCLIEARQLGYAWDQACRAPESCQPCHSIEACVWWGWEGALKERPDQIMLHFGTRIDHFKVGGG